MSVMYAVCKVTRASKERPFTALLPLPDQLLDLQPIETLPFINETLKLAFHDMTEAEVIHFLSVKNPFSVSQLNSAMEVN